MDGTDGLFYIDGQDRLTAMTVTPYQAEDVLQGLLSRHPDLLAGGQMHPHDPRRWLLVAREHGVPDRDGATSNRWSLDHLFIDQDAVPTLVEVKRSSDTRIRREVVGQMMDYAANGVLYWPVDRLREAFTVTQREKGIDPTEAVRHLTRDEEQDVEGFFGQVHENLQAGRVRLVFVADTIPDELQRIVEFLNNQMTPAEVFAVEVKQYAAGDFAGRTIVPRVVGRTATSMNKQAPARLRLSPEEHRARAASATKDLAGKLDVWAAEHGLSTTDSPQARQYRREDGSTVAELWFSYGTLDVNLVTVDTRFGAEQINALRELLQGLTSKSLTSKWPSVPAEDALAAWPQLVEVLDRLPRSTAPGQQNPAGL